MRDLFQFNVMLSFSFIVVKIRLVLVWNDQNGYDGSLLHLHEEPSHVCPPSLISRLLAGMRGIFPPIKEISRLSSNLVVMETAVT